MVYYWTTPLSEEILYDYYKELYKLYEIYESEDQYKKDFEEVNDMLNKKSSKVKSHPQKLITWINFGCDQKIEELLDSKIVGDTKAWLKQRELSLNALVLCLWSRRLTQELELSDFALRIVEKQLDEKRKHLRFPSELYWYIPHKSKAKTYTSFVNRLKRALEEILANYSSLILKEPSQLESLCWYAFNLGIIEEKHMIQIYNMVKSLQRFPSGASWIGEVPKITRSALVNMLQSKNLDVARLAAVFLLVFYESIRYFPEREIMKEAWVGDKYWELVKDKKDHWRPQYIEGMAYCRLKWKENWKDWLETIRKANTNEELQLAWCEVIKEAGYRNASDRDSLLNLLLSILESGDTFPKLIRFAALIRLEELAPSVESIGFDEKSLNLPLSPRVKISFS